MSTRLLLPGLLLPSLLLALPPSGLRAASGVPRLDYPIVATGLEPAGDTSHAAAYRDNGDGTVSDLVTGLMWEKTAATGLRYDDVAPHVAALRTGGHADWRLPTMKELFSLTDFRGNLATSTPYLDASVFTFSYAADERHMFEPDPVSKLRRIDCQYLSSDSYVGRIMQGDEAVFGFNFADGHLKAYPKYKHPERVPTYRVLAVRGNPGYGRNRFVENADGTVSDLATGLQWQAEDDGHARTWEEAKTYATKLTLAGHADWRLPTVKELHSLVDYARSPALAPPLRMSNRAAWFWSSTSFLDQPDLALYIAFGPATDFRGTDTHGAGAVRGDFKTAARDYPRGFGPQRDQMRLRNYVRAVRPLSPSAPQSGSAH
jgi:hypothetical protein